jgi:predicted Zn-dependent protease
LGREPEALSALRQAHAQLPDDWSLASDLAWMLSSAASPSLRNGREALELAQGYCAAAPEDPRGADVLAAAYAELGDFDRAVAFARRALELAQRPAYHNLVQSIQQRIQQYEMKRPNRF